MKTVYYDGSFPGFICAAGQSGYLKHTAPERALRLISTAEKQPELYISGTSCATDIENARLYYRSIRQRAGSRAASMLRLAFLAEKLGKEEILLSFLKKALQTGPSVCRMLADPDIKTVSEWETAVGREKHRYMGILRFQKTAPGLYRADFSPRYNICRILGEHFALRMHDVFWLIVDNGRKLAVFHKPEDRNLAVIMGTEQINQITPALKKYEDYEQLWQGYFNTMEIPERKNSRCQANFLPVRDRNYMTEFIH